MGVLNNEEAALAKEVNEPLNQYDQDDHRKDPLEICFESTGHLNTLTSVDFLQVIVKTPTVTGNTEQQVNQGTDRK